MFGSKNESDKVVKNGKGIPGPSSNLSTISSGTTIKGDISSEGDIRVEGVVEGTVSTKSKVAVGKSGKIEGDIVCRDADIEGRVSGKMLVHELLFIRDHAVVDGDIETSKLVVENGARFNGNMKMSSQGSSTISTPGNGKQENQQSFKKRQAV
jgi:cytoskeletal protein CcmA (bactofilin family)